MLYCTKCKSKKDIHQVCKNCSKVIVEGDICESCSELYDKEMRALDKETRKQRDLLIKKYNKLT